MKNVSVYIGVNSKKSDFRFIPGENLYTGEKVLQKEFGKLNSLELDLLNLASGIYASDLAVLREERELYVRNIELEVEVVNLDAFQRYTTLLESLLYTVSRDNWSLKFKQKSGIPITEFDWNNNSGAVLLFSGGLDSMAAASQFSQENKELVLVSHNSFGNKVVDQCQRDVHNLLERFYKKKLKHFHIKVYGRNKGKFNFPVVRENTQRTRSFLFLCLATIVTRRSNFNKILFMAENGQFAIHLPLNQSRIGPFSTHTADPMFVKLCEEYLSNILRNKDFRIENPFLYKTKAEVFGLLPKHLRENSFLSSTCWMISRIPDNKHCGFCIPCISRRISMEYNKTSFEEYNYDVFQENIQALSDTDDKRRNITDYLEFIVKFSTLNDRDILFEFPELYNDAFDQKQAILMYKRVAEQSLKVFEKYPKIKQLL